MNTIEGVIYLAKCAVNEMIPDKEIVESLNLDDIYHEASRHMIAAIVGMSLVSAGVATHALRQAVAKAQRKAVTFIHEMNIVFF